MKTSVLRLTVLCFAAIVIFCLGYMLGGFNEGNRFARLQHASDLMWYSAAYQNLADGDQEGAKRMITTGADLCLSAMERRQRFYLQDLVQHLPFVPLGSGSEDDFVNQQLARTRETFRDHPDELSMEAWLVLGKVEDASVALSPAETQ